MFYKYLMNDSLDVRGVVALVVRSSSGHEVAYTSDTVEREDYIGLVEAEINLVESIIQKKWLTMRESLSLEIDRVSDEVRTSHLAAGRSIDIEYRQVEEVYSRWVSEGSDVEDIPYEISIWSEAMGTSVTWALADISNMILNFKNLTAILRSTRLNAKRVIMTIEDEYVEEAFEMYKNALESFRNTTPSIIRPISTNIETRTFAL